MAKPTLSVLCIGGFDPSGGGGVLADQRACAAFGAHALCVATALVVQNTQRVVQVEPVDINVLAAQIETLLVDVEPAAVKVGMLPGIAAVEVIVDYLRSFQGLIPIVVDPVFSPTSGDPFNDSEAIDYISTQLMPLATIVTPNAVEAAQLTGRTLNKREDMARACIAIMEQTSAKAVMVKGGHLDIRDDDGDPISFDLLFDGEHFIELESPRETSYEVRGTGCLFASALAAQLGDGRGLAEAARSAKTWITREIRIAHVVGKGRRIAVL